VELATRLDATLPAQIPDAGAIPSPRRSLSRPRTSAHLDPVEGGAILPGSTLTCPCPLSTASPDRRLELSPLSTKSECLPTSSHVCIQPYYLQIVRCHRDFRISCIRKCRMSLLYKKSCGSRRRTLNITTSVHLSGCWARDVISKCFEKWHLYC
jgi:hypothetical protein